MDNLFGVGLPEFILILVIAGMVMGPERIVRAARSLGALTAKLQAISRSFFQQINAEIDSVDDSGQLRSTADELNQLRHQLDDLRKEVLTLTTGAPAAGKKLSSGSRTESENSIQPPDRTAQGARKRDTRITPTPAARPAASPEAVSERATPSTSRYTPLPARLDIPEDPEE